MDRDANPAWNIVRAGDLLESAAFHSGFEVFTWRSSLNIPKKLIAVLVACDYETISKDPIVVGRLNLHAS